MKESDETHYHTHFDYSRRTNARIRARQSAKNAAQRRLPPPEPHDTDAPDIARLLDRFMPRVPPPLRTTAVTTVSGQGRGRGRGDGVPPRAHHPLVNHDAPAPARAAMLRLPTGGDDLSQAKD